MPEQRLGEGKPVRLRLISLHLHLCAMKEDIVHEASFDACLPLLEDAAALDHLQPVHIDQLINSLLMLFDILKQGLVLTQNSTAI